MWRTQHLGMAGMTNVKYRIYIMDESWMLNYDNVFFCYHTEEGKVFDKTP